MLGPKAPSNPPETSPAQAATMGTNEIKMMMRPSIPIRFTHMESPSVRLWRRCLNDVDRLLANWSGVNLLQGSGPG